MVIDEREVGGPGPDRGIVFQQPTLFPWLSVQDHPPPARGWLVFPRKHTAQRPSATCASSGSGDSSGTPPGSSRGGMRQRVALARAWLPDPEILLMDEPFAALDAETRLMMQELLVSVWQETGTTILFVTHDVDEALYLSPIACW